MTAMSRVETERRDRAEQLPGFARLPDCHHGLAVELGGDSVGLALELLIARLQFGLHGLEARLVLSGRAQGLAAR